MMRSWSGWIRGARVVALTAALTAGSAGSAVAQHRVENVLVVTLDGLRWQELLGGASSAYLGKKNGGVVDSAALAARFWRPTAEARREALMPFLWGTVARSGQLFGDSTLGSLAHVTNGLWFSYPGYNEMLTGAADRRIDSNDTLPNPNVSVFEWLNRKPAYAGRVAAFGSWEVLPFILNVRRSGLPANGDGPPVTGPSTERERLLNDISDDLPAYWGATRFDAPTMYGAFEYVRAHHPRVLYVMLGETDEWAHERRYDLYLDAAWRGDRFIRRLWEMVQSMPEYAGKTALLITTDHGRGARPKDWTDHGDDTPGSGRIWIAVLGPDTPPLGVRRNTPATQSQVAATIAALLGEQFTRPDVQVAPPLSGVVP
jgi:hypothetical protein